MSHQTFIQSEFDVRCEWGESGIARLAPASDVIIIVDVLSFSTCVEIATGRGAVIIPYPWKDESARAFADSAGALLADFERSHTKYSLSPRSLTRIPGGTRLVLPSPNGSALTLKAGSTLTLAGCLRNSRAVAEAARRYGNQIAVIPAGERWDDGSLRPAFEDLIGAGAIISHLGGKWSPEARAAAAAFQNSQSEIAGLLRGCVSGRELIERGFEEDLVPASELDVSDCVPAFRDGAYRRMKA
ncbi:MAG TPA: 2-phosphosulfolactate phosphatase [Blastocatellia bacterium]|nr:2-phosphosulfolactate phosphatase [Blastocatellia bacterium]